MVFNKKTFIIAIKKYKEGIIIGAITGAIAASYAISQGVGLEEIATSGKGLLDTIMGRNAAPIGIAKTKLYITFMFFGAIIGFVTDMIVSKNFVKRKRRR